MASTMRWMVVPVLVGLVACSAKTLSGTYMARDSHGAALLQLTENQSQQVMGSMIIIQVMPDGRAERADISITGGTVDASGRSLVLVMKGNELLSQEKNVSGQVTGNGIDLAMPGGTAHFLPATPQEFDAATNVLVEAGKQQQQLQNQAKQLADDKGLLPASRTTSAHTTLTSRGCPPTAQRLRATEKNKS